MNWDDFAKYCRAQALLNMGGVVIYADTRGPECKVYSTARSHETALVFSHRTTPPIPDLDCDPVKISGTLVFSGAYHPCLIPWGLVWGVRLAGTHDASDGLIVWPESVPSDLEPALVRVLRGLGLYRGMRPT